MFARRWIVTVVVVCALVSSLGALAQDDGDADVWVCPPCPSDCHDREFDAPGRCPVCNMVLIRKTSMTERPSWKVAVVVHEGVELLDFAGPGEVFAAAAREGTAGGPPWFDVFTVAPAKGEILSQGFVTIRPQYTIDDCPAPDIIVIPGGATGRLTRDEPFMSWVQRVAPDADVVLSVCTGAFVLAQTGMLDGLEATTHHSAIESLRAQAPNATIHTDRRLVDNGRIVTAGGVSAGIDGALHVVARLLGREVAQNTADYMEYRWTPSERDLADAPKRNPYLDQRGRALDEAARMRSAERWDEAAAAYRRALDADASDGRTWYDYGYSLHAAGRLEEALAAHRRAAELLPEGPTRVRALYNVACALALQGRADPALNALERAIDAGFSDRAWAMQDADLESLRDLPRFRSLLEGLDG